MKNRFIIALIGFIIIFAAVFIILNIQPNNEAEEYYIEYLETALVDRELALWKYHHYEIPLAQELALASVNNKLYSYEIVSCNQLSDQLWVLTAFLKTDLMPAGGTVINFVGIINGSYKVMTSVAQVPDYLKESLDLSSYVDPNAIDFSDIIY